MLVDEGGEAARLEAGAVVGDERDRPDLAGRGVGDALERAGGRAAARSRRARCSTVSIASRWFWVGRDVPAELELRPVVGDAADPPGAAHPCLELGEVELPDLVRPRGRHHERRPAGFGVLAPFGLVVDLQHPAGALQRPVDGRVGRVVAVDPHQHRDRPRAPLPGSGRRSRSRPARSGRPPGSATAPSPAGPAAALLPAPVGALRHPISRREARRRHPCLEADHLEVLVGPRRSSALFFQTRSSTCASPSAAFSSSTRPRAAAAHAGSAAACRPRRGPALPPSRNCRFQVEIDCSDAFPRRAASATLISPEMTARTSLNLSSTEKTEGRATISSLHEEPDTNRPARFREAGHSHEPYCTRSQRLAYIDGEGNHSRRSTSTCDPTEHSGRAADPIRS